MRWCKGTMGCATPLTPLPSPLPSPLPPHKTSLRCYPLNPPALPTAAHAEDDPTPPCPSPPPPKVQDALVDERQDHQALEGEGAAILSYLILSYLRQDHQALEGEGAAGGLSLLAPHSCALGEHSQALQEHSGALGEGEGGEGEGEGGEARGTTRAGGRQRGRERGGWSIPHDLLPREPLPPPPHPTTAPPHARRTHPHSPAHSLRAQVYGKKIKTVSNMNIEPRNGCAGGPAAVMRGRGLRLPLMATCERVVTVSRGVGQPPAASPPPPHAAPHWMQATPKRTFANAHAYHINSVGARPRRPPCRRPSTRLPSPPQVALCSDGESFLSCDDLRRRAHGCDAKGHQLGL